MSRVAVPPYPKLQNIFLEGHNDNATTACTANTQTHQQDGEQSGDEISFWPLYA